MAGRSSGRSSATGTWRPRPLMHRSRLRRQRGRHRGHERGEPLGRERPERLAKTELTGCEEHHEKSDAVPQCTELTPVARSRTVPRKRACNKVGWLAAAHRRTRDIESLTNTNHEARGDSVRSSEHCLAVASGSAYCARRQRALQYLSRQVRRFNLLKRKTTKGVPRPPSFLSDSVHT